MKKLFITCFIVIFVSCRAFGAVITLTASMNGFEARPSNLTPGSGSASATIDDATGAFLISGSSLSLRPAVEVSIRGPNNPPTDEWGPLVLELSFSSGPDPNPQSLAFATTFSGNAVFDRSQIAELLAGHDFVALHASLGTPRVGPDLGGSLTVPEPSLPAFGLISAIAMLGSRATRRSK